jgi:hypothetical protein
MSSATADPRTTTPRAIVTQRLTELPALIRENRKRRGLAPRPAAVEVGVPLNTLRRAEHGKTPDGANLLAILEWLELPPAWFTGGGDNPADAYRRGWNDCANSVRGALEPAADVAGGAA